MPLKKKKRRKSDSSELSAIETRGPVFSATRHRSYSDSDQGHTARRVKEKLGEPLFDKLSDSFKGEDLVLLHNISKHLSSEKIKELKSAIGTPGFDEKVNRVIWSNRLAVENHSAFHGEFDNDTRLKKRSTNLDVFGENIVDTPEQIVINMEREKMLAANSNVRRKFDNEPLNMTMEDIAITSNRSGIPYDHVKAIAKVASLRNEVIMMRPVNQTATDLIESGYATKNLHIKSKSSDWGPMEGLIPVKGELSKLGNPKKSNVDSAAIQKSSHMAQIAIENGWAKPVKLERNGMKAVMEKGKPLTAKWIPVAQDLGEGYEAIEVLGDPVNFKPIAPDYDIFAIGPHISRYNALSHQERNISDVHMGKLNAIEQAAVSDINIAVQAAGGYEGGRVSHHGPETKNPVTELDFPVTAFMPYGETVIINDQAGLVSLFNKMNSKGYHLDPNEKWLKGEFNGNRWIGDGPDTFDLTLDGRYKWAREEKLPKTEDIAKMKDEFQVVMYNEDIAQTIRNAPSISGIIAEARVWPSEEKYRFSLLQEQENNQKQRDKYKELVGKK